MSCTELFQCLPCLNTTEEQETDADGEVVDAEATDGKLSSDDE
jgi:hypothetical protein